MTLYVVATPIGNMEDITLRALRILDEVPIIAAEDTRSLRNLLTHHRLRAGRPAPRIYSFFAGNEAARTAQLVQALKAGEDVALVSEAGLPGVSDPGQRLIAAAKSAALRVEVLPGACAALTALIGSGLPTERFLFVGFLPRRSGPCQAVLSSLLGESGTLIFYEAPDRVADTLHALAATFGFERQGCVARELTKMYEEYATSTLGELAERYSQTPPRGEVTIVVAGCSAEAREQNAPLEAAELEAAIVARLQAGQRPREISAALALQSNQPRRKLYQLAVALERTTEDSQSQESASAKI